MKIELVCILHDLELGSIRIEEAYRKILNLFEECNDARDIPEWEDEL